MGNLLIDSQVPFTTEVEKNEWEAFDLFLSINADGFLLLV